MSPTKPPTPVADGRHSVRIIGGSWRGRRVSFPGLPDLRPTPDRVRETLFNWLRLAVADARCLDLFAGSGALGLEALSRGAVAAVFVERSPVAARCLRAELVRLGGSARGRVVEMGAARFLRAPRENHGGPFDIVFMDPPFDPAALPEYLPLLAAGGWVKPGGLVYLEDARTGGAPGLPADWELLKSKSAGEVGYHLARANTHPVTEMTAHE